MSIPVGIELLRAALALTEPHDPQYVELVAELLGPLSAGRPDYVEVLARTLAGRVVPVATECTIVQALATTRYRRPEGDRNTLLEMSGPH